MSFDKEKDAKRKPVNAWDTPVETWQYVTVPEETPLGKQFPAIRLNKDTFEAGKTYNVPAEIAAYVNDRVKVAQRADVRLLQPNADLRSINEVARGSTFSNVLGHQSVAVDATKITTL
jgi:hypothetical protein